jgi:hypothetical protein
MRFMRPRFTIRWLMILVAIVAVSLAGTVLTVRLKRRAERFSQRATVFAEWEDYSRTMLAVDVQRLTSIAHSRELNAEILRNSDRFSPEFRELVKKMMSLLKNDEMSLDDLARDIQYHRACRAHEAQMRQKYERAARRPWERVAPDPPAPAYPARKRASPVSPASPDPPAQERGPSRDEPVFTSVAAAAGVLAVRSPD